MHGLPESDNCATVYADTVGCAFITGHRTILYILYNLYSTVYCVPCSTLNAVIELVQCSWWIRLNRERTHNGLGFDSPPLAIAKPSLDGSVCYHFMHGSGSDFSYWWIRNLDDPDCKILQQIKHLKNKVITFLFLKIRIGKSNSSSQTNDKKVGRKKWRNPYSW